MAETKWLQERRTVAPVVQLKPEESVGRESGAQEWKAERGELGPAASPATVVDTSHEDICAVFTSLKKV